MLPLHDDQTTSVAALRMRGNFRPEPVVIFTEIRNDCKCHIEKCDKDLQPDCVDIGLCLDCPLPRPAPPPKTMSVLPSSAARAAEFMSELMEPSYTYEIRDVNRDGIYEILEHVPEGDAVEGIRNLKVLDGFTWINVYRQESGSFHEATGDFPQVLAERMVNYQIWYQLLDDPRFLEERDQNLIQKRRNLLREVLLKKLQRIDMLAKNTAKCK